MDKKSSQEGGASGEKIKLCPHCQKEIPMKANKCSFCQSDLRNWAGRHKFLTVVLIFIGVITLLSLIGNSSSPKNDSSSTTVAPSTQQQEQVMQVTAIQLVKDYEANEVSADAQYKGKLVEVAGTINAIGKDILDTPYVSLQSNSPSIIFGVQCMFDKSEQAQLVSLAKDTKITLRGRVSGKMGNVLVRECSIVQ